MNPCLAQRMTQWRKQAAALLPGKTPLQESLLADTERAAAAEGSPAVGSRYSTQNAHKPQPSGEDRLDKLCQATRVAAAIGWDIATAPEPEARVVVEWRSELAALAAALQEEVAASLGGVGAQHIQQALASLDEVTYVLQQLQQVTLAEEQGAMGEQWADVPLDGAGAPPAPYARIEDKPLIEL